MSSVSAKLETAKIIELKEELEKTPYPKLKKKLTEIGVPDAWVMGEDKDVIVRSAMQMLEKLGLEETKPEVIEEIISEVVKEEIVTEVIEETVIEEEVKEVLEPVITPIVEYNISIDQIVTVKETVETKVLEVEAEIVFKEDDPRKYISPFKDASIEDLHKNVERIDNLMKGSPDFHKVILIAKKKQITDRLIELGE